MREDGGIHCLGNGQLCVYERGADILQVFGPPYSCPVMGELTVEGGEQPAESLREPGAAIWTHRLEGVELVDFVDPEIPCLVRRVRTSRPLRLRLVPNPAAVLTPAGERLSGAGGWLLEIPAGAFYYGRYPFPRPVFYQAAWRGPTSSDLMEDGSLAVTCEPGESWLYLAGGPEYPQVVEHIESILTAPGDERLALARASWSAIAAARQDWPALLPEALPERARLLQAVDDVAVLVKTQQSAQGGVLAGHNYHMCYVRDQYGTARGLLSMGHVQEARAILAFYWDIWRRHGRIYNAQAAGVDGSFHIHENDDVEITGYLVRQAFDLLAADGEEGFFAEIFPMLEWAFEAQKRHLVGSMLPFNGDETYVAGGILPRSALNDGSAESTLLFLESGERLAGWAEASRRWDSARCAEARGLLSEVRTAYRRNFWTNGQLAANQPQRVGLPGSTPRFRHGVCERCMDEGRFRAVGWTERSAAGRYLCPACLALGPYEAARPRRYLLQSVSLTPFYFQSKLFSKEELAPGIEAILESYRTAGSLPSRPDDERGISVGYDYGFLLYALAELCHPAAREIYETTLSLADSTGAWVEYYVRNQPSGTRCRPWESAINLEALLHYAQKTSP